MKLLQVISTVNPKGGGPIAGVNQLNEVFREHGVVVAVCSLDDPESPWVVESQTKVFALGPTATKYGYNNRLLPWLKSHAHEYDAVIVHGLWEYNGFAVWRALSGTSTPYYVFAHGMLGPWFKHTYPLKHLKKWLYWPWAEYRVLRDARRVLFTSDSERILARKSFWLYKANEAICGFGVTNPPADSGELKAHFLNAHPELQGKRIALFLGRIHFVKGCDLLVEAFAAVAMHNKDIHMVIAGPDQDRLVPALKLQAEKLGVSDRITWLDMLQSADKWSAFYAAEVFCLPSHHENFGVVVAEALACGKPVLISNKVNIWREIDSDQVGFVDTDTVEGTARNFERWLTLSESEYSEMSVRATNTFASRFHIDRVSQRLLEILRREA